MRFDRRRTVSRICLVLAPGLLLAVLLARPAPISAVTYVVTNTHDAGPGSLRQAILNTNAQSGQDTIAFDIPPADPGYDLTSGTWTIVPQTPLPCLSDPAGTIIDGATQAINRGDTNAEGPEVVLRGHQLGGSMALLCLQANANHVLSLVLRDAPGPAVNITSLSWGNIVRDNYIGTTDDGLTAAPNLEGVHVWTGSENNVIAHNVISGNTQDGIVISGNENRIRRNTIGLTRTGGAPLPNDWDGIVLYNGAKNVIGGEPGYRNTVSGNGLNGIRIDGATETEIGHNYIGLATDGVIDRGNRQHGVLIEAAGGGTAVYANVISGNDASGVMIRDAGTDYTYVHNNLIGTEASGRYVVGNGHHGVGVYNGPFRTYVGDANWAPQGNVIVGSGWSGVAIVNASKKTEVGSNAIGTDAAGTATDMGNGHYGVHVVNSWQTTIAGNHIAHNGTAATRAGVRIEGTVATGNTITENSLHDNSGLGIEVVDGANGGIAAPSILQADCWHVEGQACAGCTVELFSDAGSEGRFHEATAPAHSVLPSFAWNGALRGPNVTATVRDAQGNTSEFGVMTAVCFRTFIPAALK